MTDRQEKDIYKELLCGIAEVYNNLNGIVVIISDDGDYRTGVNINQLTTEYEVSISVAGVAGAVNNKLNEWKQMLAGNERLELVNHSFSHVNMSPDKPMASDYQCLFHEIIDAKKFFEEEFHYQQITFCCPYNKMSSLGIQIMQENGIYACRKGARDFNPLSPEDRADKPGAWFWLCCYGIKDDGVTTSVRNGWIDYAIDKHKWLIEMWHNVLDHPGANDYQPISMKEAKEHLVYVEQKVKEKEIWNLTFTDCVKYIRER